MKLSKLKKMKMPEKKGEEMEGMEMTQEAHEKDDPALAAAEEEYGMDLDQDMEAGEPAAHKAKVQAGAPAELEAVSDDELMAELKKRGLMSKMKEEPEEEADEQYI